MYLFLRYKFHWNEFDFSIFNAYQMAIISLGKTKSINTVTRSRHVTVDNSLNVPNPLMKIIFL